MNGKVNETLRKLLEKYNISINEFDNDRKNMEKILKQRLLTLEKNIYELCMYFWVRAQTFMGDPEEYLETCKDLIIELVTDLLVIEAKAYWYYQKQLK